MHFVFGIHETVLVLPSVSSAKITPAFAWCTYENVLLPEL